MRTLVYFIIYLITNSIVAQAVITSEDIAVWNDNIQIPGTLLYDSSLKKQPLVIFVHGSGDVDRDGNQKGRNINVNYIKLLSEKLSANGIAFYRYDKRTSIKDNFKSFKGKMSFDVLKDDVTKTIDQFRDDKRFSSINLIGHSQGSLVAMISVDEAIDKYISLAGLGQSIDKFVISEYEKTSPLYGKIVEAHFNELSTTGKIDKVDQLIVHILAKPNQNFVLSWMQYDPAKELKKLDIPILILNGTKDLQVKKEQAELLHKANTKSKLVIIENMNHKLKTVTKDNSSNYPLSKEMVTLITDFIKE